MQKLNFDEWMEKLDRWMLTEVGLTHKGIEDQPYQRWYLDGVKAISAAQWALKNVGLL